MNCQGWTGDGKTCTGIEWLRPPIPHRPGFTWNVVTGCTNDFCEVRLICWAREQAMRHGDGAFLPRFHEDRLDEPLRRTTPAIIAAVLSGDLFSDGVQDDWIMQVLKVIESAQQHVFVILTKNALRLMGFHQFFPKNLWIGTSITTEREIDRIDILRHVDAVHRLVSFEPLRGEIGFTPLDLGIDWFIIGGQSRPWIHPDRAWIDDLIEQAHKRNIPVLVKRNAQYSSGPQALWTGLQEWPRAILEHLQPKVGGDS
jgi:protein gp37